VLRSLDEGALRFLRTRGHSAPAERAMSALALVTEWGLLWTGIGLAAAAIDQPRRARWLRVSAIGPLAVGVNHLAKVAVRRERPRLPGLPALGRVRTSRSFPSAHAASSTAAATAISRVVPTAGPPAYALATLVCLTRPYLGAHYPSDVLAGAALGLALGRAWPGLGDGGRAPAGGVRMPPPPEMPLARREAAAP